MPEIGEIRSGLSLGYRANYKLIWHACEGCGKERWVGIIKGKPRRLRCLSCTTKGNRGRSAYKNGQTYKNRQIRTGGGYNLVRLYRDDFFYPMATKHSYVLEHRLVVAKALGRCLHRWEIVHHKHTRYPKGSIEDKQDNRIENLQLVTDDRHTQITLLENRIGYLEKRLVLLEAENVALRI